MSTKMALTLAEPVTHRNSNKEGLCIPDMASSVTHDFEGLVIKTKLQDPTDAAMGLN